MIKQKQHRKFEKPRQCKKKKIATKQVNPTETRQFLGSCQNNHYGKMTGSMVGKILLSCLLFSEFIVVVESFLTISSSSASSLTVFYGGTTRRRRYNRITSLLVSSSADQSSLSPPKWLDKGLLLSSFTDGLKANPQVQDWLYEALVERLWREEQQKTQTALEQSNKFSPCNGPDPIMWEQLEEIDQVVDELYPSSSTSNTQPSSSTRAKVSSSIWRQSLDRLLSNNRRLKDQTNNYFNDDDDGDFVELRLLYIPTAMYALRSDSINTPGKQRQRARADSKKRRNEIVSLLASNLNGVSISAVTLDLDDGSVKQPECSHFSDDDSGNSKNKRPQFPTSGREAITKWKPHLIYVQGGNTFWLHHCMEKGDWGKDFVAACCSGGPSVSSAVYCGVSAGAILVGHSMQTACWKGWDDPSIVAGRETYQDWKHVQGLSLVGCTSFFPHMEDHWQSVVNDRTKELIEYLDYENEGGSSYDFKLLPTVCCLSDEQACLVEGEKQSIQVVSMVPQMVS